MRSKNVLKSFRDLRPLRNLAFVLFLLVLHTSVSKADQVINFDDLSDGDIVTTQYQSLGVTFSNTLVQTVGLSLNEFDFPPESGTNVAIDNGGPISITFVDPILTFGAYFTYLEPLTVDAFDASGDLVDVATSLFSDNLGYGDGDTGSSPDEFIPVTFASGISSVTITGDPFGYSFAMDDATITDLPETGTSVPEPGSLSILLIGVLALAAFVGKERRPAFRFLTK